MGARIPVLVLFWVEMDGMHCTQDHEDFEDVFKSGYCSTETAQLHSTCSGLHVIIEDCREDYQILT
jgi:hypothetical protein